MEEEARFQESGIRRIVSVDTMAGNLFCVLSTVPPRHDDRC